MTNRRRIRRFLPPQHGAWAMLLLPYAVGVVLVGPHWPQVPLLGAWLAGYLLSYYAFQAIKSRRPRRFADQLLAYGLVTTPLALIVLFARPTVLWYAPVYAVLLTVNAGYAWRRRSAPCSTTSPPWRRAVRWSSCSPPCPGCRSPRSSPRSWP